MIQTMIVQGYKERKTIIYIYVIFFIIINILNDVFNLIIPVIINKFTNFEWIKAKPHSFGA